MFWNVNLNRSLCLRSSFTFWFMFTSLMSLNVSFWKYFPISHALKRTEEIIYHAWKNFYFIPLYVVAWYLSEIKYLSQVAQMNASIWPHLHHPGKLDAFMRCSFVSELFCYIIFCSFLYYCEVTISKRKRLIYLNMHGKFPWTKSTVTWLYSRVDKSSGKHIFGCVF